MTLQIHSLYCYPLKSCRGIQLEQAELTRTGIRLDRHWMLVDRDGGFLSQRKHPRMALIETALTSTDTLLCRTSSGQLEIPVEQSDGQRLEVSIWKDRCTAVRVSTETSEFFSDFLDTHCDLVFLPDNERRRVDPTYASQGQTVGFADGFPLLVFSLASIELLAQKLGESVAIERFRPNIVVQGCAAHAEDQWSTLDIDGLTIDLVKPCSRCAIPGIDPHTAQSHPTLLRTLASYRRRNGKVYFGQNGLHRGPGVIYQGQQVIVKES